MEEGYDCRSFWSGLGHGGNNDSLLFFAFLFFENQVSHCASGGCVWRGNGNVEALNGLRVGYELSWGGKVVRISSTWKAAVRERKVWLDWQ